MTTWRKQLTYALGDDDAFENIVSCTLSEDELDVEFDDGYGGAEGVPFTVWTAKYVYFPTEYDGAESVARASRNPDNQPTNHI